MAGKEADAWHTVGVQLVFAEWGAGDSESVRCRLRGLAFLHAQAPQHRPPSRPPHPLSPLPGPSSAPRGPTSSPLLPSTSFHAQGPWVDRIWDSWSFGFQICMDRATHWGRGRSAARCFPCLPTRDGEGPRARSASQEGLGVSREAGWRPLLL